MQTLFDAEQPHTASRLDAIYAQLKELQSFKDDIMGDLDEFMDEVAQDPNVDWPQ